MTYYLSIVFFFPHFSRRSPLLAEMLTVIYPFIIFVSPRYAVCKVSMADIIQMAAAQGVRYSLRTLIFFDSRR